MAKPWSDGSEHSVLFGSENASVKRETIHINLKYDDLERCYFANYTIRYIISSEQKQTLPLLFIAVNLDENKKIMVNNNSSKIIPLDLQNTTYPFIEKNGDQTFVKYDDANKIYVNQNDLLYFSANLEKGDNIIEVKYDAELTYNTFGFIRNYELEYSLAPSRFWKSFGPINVKVTFGDKLEFKQSNLGKEKADKNTLEWTITPQNREDLKIVISERTSFISKVLLFLDPFGLSLIALLAMFFIHLKLMRKYPKTYVLILGIILVPILFYVIYFLSYSLIDFSLGKAYTKHGYVFLYVVTYPFLLLIYGILMWMIYKRRKASDKNVANT